MGHKAQVDITQVVGSWGFSGRQGPRPRQCKQDLKWAQVHYKDPLLSGVPQQPITSQSPAAGRSAVDCLADIIWILNLVKIREQRHSWPQSAIRRRHAHHRYRLWLFSDADASIDREPGYLATASKQGWQLAGDQAHWRLQDPETRRAPSRLRPLTRTHPTDVAPITAAVGTSSHLFDTKVNNNPEPRSHPTCSGPESKLSPN